MNLTTFLKLHEQFMSEEDPLSNKYLCGQLSELLNQIDDPREIKNPLHPDGVTYGYVAIKRGMICLRNGGFLRHILAGDVLVLQFNWNRNIAITNLPLDQNVPIPFILRDTEHIHGYKGVWLPIFDPVRIRGFAEMQIKKYQQSLNELLNQEEAWWKTQMQST